MKMGKIHLNQSLIECVTLAASVVFGTQVRGFKPGRSRRIFQGENTLSTPSFGREVKPFVPCRRDLRRVKDP